MAAEGVATTGATGGIFKRLDQLNEFERQPVAKDNLYGGMYFAGSFAGEHVAATEFVIGALFVIWGASAVDVIVGLLLGNLLAVLSWTLVCAPIAVQTRLTLYWYLRRIGGPVVMVVYNVLNAVLYCILAGCMITVAASAVRIPLNITPQTGWLPTDPWFVPVVIGVGAVVVTLAILGFKRLAEFASVCSPWMLLMFVVGALALLPQIGSVEDPSAFWRIASQRIWAGDPPAFQSMTKEEGRTVLSFRGVDSEMVSVGGGPLRGFFVTEEGPERGEERKWVDAEATIDGLTVSVASEQIKDPVAVRYQKPETADGVLATRQYVSVAPFTTDVAAAGRTIGFWHIVAFAWICNLAMHLGLSDMALFRYAKRPWYGLYSACGMYLGHYVAWICAGIMGAAAALLLTTPLEYLDSGQVAFTSLGWMGALAVVIAGWTTSNPTLYRAGLALQVVTPGWPRWLVTLIAGVITTAVACFPFVFRELLNFVAIYGILLVPVGAIVVTEHWIFPRIGYTQYWNARKGNLLNWPALVSWLVALAFAAACWGSATFFGREIIHQFFLVIPVWIITTVLYLVLAPLAGARQQLPELPEETPAVSAAGASPAPQPAAPSPTATRLYWLSGFVAVACLLMILGFGLAVFFHWMLPEHYNSHLNFLTLVYFASGVIWMRFRSRRRAALQAVEA